MNIQELKDLAPVLSLLVALLAVFVGPFISWKVANSQSKISLQIANKQIIGPMRQAWINTLRDIVSDLLGKSAHYWAAGYEDREDDEYRYITELLSRLELQINPNEDDHALLVVKAYEMQSHINSNNMNTDEVFWRLHKEVKEIAQQILKREWDRTKQEI